MVQQRNITDQKIQRLRRESNPLLMTRCDAPVVIDLDLIEKLYVYCHGYQGPTFHWYHTVERWIVFEIFNQPMRSLWQKVTNLSDFFFPNNIGTNCLLVPSSSPEIELREKWRESLFVIQSLMFHMNVHKVLRIQTWYLYLRFVNQASRSFFWSPFLLIENQPLLSDFFF